MDYPSLMPKELSPYLNSPSEESLFDALVKKPDDLVLFFANACDDETWTENHVPLMRKLSEWITDQTYQARLSHSNIDASAKAIQKHESILQYIIPNNIVIKLKDAEIPFNGILLTAASDFFKQILIQLSLKESNVLALPQLSEEEFYPIKAFVATGSVPKLGTKGQQEIIDLIKRAKAWELTDLSIVCSNMARKYLNQENVLDVLTKSRRDGLVPLEQSCVEFINQQDWDYKLSVPHPQRLAFEFLNFHEPTIDFFEELRPMITDIICGGDLVEQPQFGLILKECSDLFCLDISRSTSFSIQFQEIPQKLRALNVSECRWMSKDAIKKFIVFCPNLEELVLQSNVHLNYSFWAELVNFKRLNRLDLTNCNQLQDSDLSIILKGLNVLTSLSLNNCKKIDEKGFVELARSLPRLIKLSLSRTNISDTALIEITSKCRALTQLDVSGCSQISEKGIFAILKDVLSLKELNIVHCNISDTSIDEIRRSFPSLILRV